MERRKWWETLEMGQRNQIIQFSIFESYFVIAFPFISRVPCTIHPMSNCRRLIISFSDTRGISFVEKKN